MRSKKDAELTILKKISSAIKAADVFFVLTGSYAIEALTKHNLKHGDIDANIFGENIKRNMQDVATIIKNLASHETSIKLYKKTQDRLEYDIHVATRAHKILRLELHFFKTVKIMKQGNNVVMFTKIDHHIYKIPTTTSKLYNPLGQPYAFRVKTLSYTIATWAIRISGAAINTKRVIAPRDIKNLKALMSINYRKKEIIAEMAQHPQMPTGVDAEQLFNKVSLFIK